MRPLARRERAAVVAGGVAALLIVLYLFAFLPRLIALGQATRQLHRKAAELSDIRQVAARLPTVEREHAEVAGRLAEIERQIPKSLEVSELVAQLNGAMQASGVQLIELTLPEGQPAPDAPGAAGLPAAAAPGGPVEGLEEYPFSLKIRGTFAQTVAFTRRIEGLTRLVAVQRLGISLGTDPRGYAVLEISLSADTFVLR